MSAHIETVDLPRGDGHPTAQVVALPLDSQVVDAHVEPDGTVVLTVTDVRHRTTAEQVVYLLGERGVPAPNARFVRTVVHHDLHLVLHVLVAPLDDHTRRDVEHAARR
ncbi:MAG: hypothetical protein JWR42_165 [Marmoricola sp.]|nr:hypothetical protein [Marmoricola sp.]